jgi:pyruvyltransferase
MAGMLAPLKQIMNNNREMLTNKEKINVIWWNGKNWGDALNVVLIQYLSGLKPFEIIKYTFNPKNEPIYTAIGSILDFAILSNDRILKNTIIWGSGFMEESGRLHRAPRQICAVRGPLTRENIQKSGFDCPEIYGDPALLYPYIYRPPVNKRYKLGIIPHHHEKENNLLRIFENYPEIKLIDIEGPINTVVDEICSCRYIASSSLHGIIAADAYGVPSVWIKLSDKIRGGGFKFRDYFGSVGRSETEPLVISEKITVDSIYDSFYHYKIDIDLPTLLEVCPFYNSTGGSHQIDLSLN